MCGRYDISSMGVSFCKACLGDIRPTKPPSPARRPEESAEMQNNTPYRKVSSVAAYSGTLKETIKTFKFRGKKSLGKYLAAIMAEDFLNKLTPSDYDIIVPVPIHRKRLEQRQYNQSDILAAAISKAYSIPITFDVLIQAKPSLEQVRLSAKDRWSNTAGKYEVRKTEKIKGKSILLIDDVFTTGATSYECSEVLRKYCKFVDIFTLARSK